MYVFVKKVTFGFFIIATLLLNSCSQPSVAKTEKKQKSIDIKVLTKKPHESYSR